MRWPTVDDAPDAALFGVEEVVGPERGTGRMSGLEFLPVVARRVLNPVPKGSRMPFRWTVNVYRGCSHACTYCLDGNTPVRRADGTDTALADLRAGDEIVGTAWHGADRVTQPTTVVDTWTVRESAVEVLLDDDTRLIAGRDHRFLGTRGWKYVTDDRRRHSTPRPHLRIGDELIVPGADDRPDARRTVVSLKASGGERKLVDVTTGTGDFVAAGVVSHNCFARPTHEYLGLNTGDDFDRRIVVKINAVERVRAELSAPSWGGEAVAMGTNTDPYQRAEGKYRLTRGVIGALSDHANPFSILTKSALVLRDLDLLERAARRTEVSVTLSIGTLDERVWRATEPGTPNPRRRLEAMRRLADAGIRTGALVAPVLPGLSDSAEHLAEVAEQVREHGGRVVGVSALHLRPGVREHFLTWLAGHDPELHRDYRRRYADRDYAPRVYHETLQRRLGLDPSQGRDWHRTD